nr:isoform 2 of ankyrin-3 [Quercus suber]
MFEKDVLPVLQAVFPQSCIRYGVNDADQLSKNHMQLLIYAMTNNLAGLDPRVSLRMIYDYLKDPLARLLQSNAVVNSQLGISIDAPAFQSMMEIYFRCAIEAGDTRAVEYLLENPDVDIEVNQQNVMVEGVQYTVIERSAKLQHLEMTRLLLVFGADPNKSHGTWLYDGFHSHVCHSGQPKCEYMTTAGAMNCAMEGHTSRSPVGYDLVRILLENGSMVSNWWLCKIIFEEDVFMMDVLLRYGLQSHFKRWVKNRFLHAAVTRLHVRQLSELFIQLRACGFDFSEFSYHKRDHGMRLTKCPHCPWTLMDSAALRGELLLVTQLHSYGAYISNNTTVAAVRSSNFGLIRYLLDNGAQVDGFSDHFLTTALAQSIQMQSSDILGITSEYMSRVDKNDELSNWAMLAAFAAIGNVSAVEHLICLPGAFNSQGLGFALLQATAADRTAIAVTLLEAGASTKQHEITNALEVLCEGLRPNASSHFQVSSALSAAIKNRNTFLVRTLLEHNAELVDTIEPTIAWNNLPLLEDLIFAGALELCEETLSTAVDLSSTACLEHLCQLGEMRVSVALCQAVRMNEISAVKLFLRYNTEALREETLEIAMDRGSDMFQLILQYCRQTRPKGIRRLGRSALVKAIESGRHHLAWSLIDAGAALPTSLRSGEQPLAVAMRSNLSTNLGLVEMILEHDFPIESVIDIGAVNSVNRKDRRTALMVAISTGSQAMVQLILKYGANVNTPASRGALRTPLQLAAEIGSLKVVQLLLIAGADINAAPAQRSGLTALQAAAKGGFLGLVELLVGHGADPTSPGGPVDGRCAIEAAAEHGRTDMVSYLHRLGVWPTEKLKSAMYFAKDSGYDSTVKVLQRAIKDRNARASDELGSLAVRHLNISGLVSNDVAPSPPDEISLLQEDDLSDLDTQLYSPELITEEGSSYAAQHYPGEVDMDVDSQADEPAEQGQHICQQCSPPLALSNASALRRHQRSKHNDVFPAPEYECIVCLKTFNRRDTLKRHQATHDKQELEACTSCRKSFRKDYLRVHVRTCKA